MTAEQAAQQAMSLRDNEAFQSALNSLRTDALEALARCPATGADAIREYQATIRVVDSLREKITDAIRAGASRNPPGIV